MQCHAGLTCAWSNHQTTCPAATAGCYCSCGVVRTAAAAEHDPHLLRLVLPFAGMTGGLDTAVVSAPAWSLLSPVDTTGLRF